MARSKSKHIRVIMKRRQRWRRRLKAKKVATKAVAAKK